MAKKKLKFKVGDEVIYVGHPDVGHQFTSLLGTTQVITHIRDQKRSDNYDYSITFGPVMEIELKPTNKTLNLKEIKKFLGVKE